MTENSKYSSVNEGMFPSTAAQNYHTLHDLKKKHNFILSQFWRPEVQNQGVARAMLRLEALTEISFLLPTSGGFQPSLQLDHSNFCPCLQRPFTSVCLSLLFLCLCVSPLCLQWKHLKLNSGPTRAIQDDLILWSLTQIYLQRLCLPISFHSQVTWIRMWTWGP